MSRYLDQIKNQLIADLTVNNELQKQNIQELKNELWDMYQEVKSLRGENEKLIEKNKTLSLTVNELRQALIKKQRMIWTNNGDL